MTLLPSTRSVVLALLLAISVCGCTMFGNAGPLKSADTRGLTPAQAAVIADDITAALRPEVGPGTTTFRLSLDGSVFGKALEASLRGRGYGTVTDRADNGPKATTIAYLVSAHEDRLLVRLSTPTLELARIYKDAASGTQPDSPLSIMRRDEIGAQ